MKKSFIYLLFTCAGIVLGSLLSNLTASVKGLTWLSYGLNFGLTKPFVLDLSVLELTLGATFRLNVAVIICTGIALLIAYNTVGRRRR